VPQRRAALEKLVLHATNLRIPIVEVEGGSLTALAGFDGHQGVALVVEPRRFASLDEVLARAAERDEPPFILVLDSLEDPHNVGTLLRSAEAAGVHGVLFPTHRQAPLSPSAVKASAGAIEHLLLCPVDDLPGALSDLHSRGVRVGGAEGDAPLTARQTDLRGPLAIVVGSEGQGLGPAVRRRCDLFMRIPMKGAVGSLNAAVAGSILLFEALAQREPNAAPRSRQAAETSPVDEESPEVEATASTTPIAAAADAPDPATVSTPKRRVRKGLWTEPADSAAADEASTKPEPTAPKRRVRKAASTEPADSAAADEASTKAEPTAPKRRVRKAASTEPADSVSAGEAIPAAEASTEPSTATPKPRARKGVSTKSAAPRSDAAPGGAEPDDDADLLPPDGARKRRSRLG
jgi:23S rRNA (guanosine2251-2'-O)-methyltransferase